MNLDAILQTFIAESREQLEIMEDALLSASKAESSAETINSIFRAAHTIKGSAGMFSLDGIVDFTHVVESVLDEVRGGRIALSRELVTELLACRDHIVAMIEAVAAGERQIDDELTARGRPLLDKLQRRLSREPAARAAVAAAAEPARPQMVHWHISLRFNPEVLSNGTEPLALIRYLGTLGRITGLVTLHENIPPLARMDAESCYLGFEIGLESAAGRAAIENTFEFAVGHCRVRMVEAGAPAGVFARLIHQSREGAATMGAALLRCGSLSPERLAALLAESAEYAGEAPAVPAVPPPAAPEAAAASPPAVAEGKAAAPPAAKTRSIRVDADKLDRLINLVGELIIAAESTNLVARRSQAADILECTAKLAGLVSDVRDSALDLRMVKIGSTFGRFQRVVHDVARELDKDIELVVAGEDTELDKTVVEKLIDPLTHLVRNAIDHGIEPAEKRRECGKAATGTVSLNAFHDSGSIVIEVSDDGGGLNRDAIHAKAVERGLIDPALALSDEEIYALIFEPGFSTAEKITTISGRGVGMDVVKRNITALRGSVDIRSEPGKGTTMSVRLPLTLAIIDGFLVSVGGSVFVIPLEMIEECVAFNAGAGGDYMVLRGQVLPFTRLRELFDIGQPEPKRANVVVVRHAGRRAGLVVDELLGECQTVIKPLGRIFTQLRCISGSSILGSGEVALIVDVATIVRLACERELRTLAA